MNSNELQVGGQHYKGSYQHWDFVADSRMGYFEGNATKYVCRYRSKGGKEDLEKAIHYIDKLIELVEQGRAWANPGRPEPLEISSQFFKLRQVYGLGHWQVIIIRQLCQWHSVEDLHTARQSIRTLMESIQ